MKRAVIFLLVWVLPSICKKTQYQESAVKWSTIKWGMSVYFMYILWFWFRKFVWMLCFDTKIQDSAALKNGTGQENIWVGTKVIFLVWFGLVWSWLKYYWQLLETWSQDSILFLQMVSAMWRTAERFLTMTLRMMPLSPMNEVPTFRFPESAILTFKELFKIWDDLVLGFCFL